MEGVITAVVAFIFTCIVFPSLVKSRPQYYGALALILLAIFLDALGIALSDSKEPSTFRTFVMIVDAILVICSIGLLMLATGGLSARDLAADIGKTIEVVRRGGEKETIIVPMSERPLSEDEKVYVPRKRTPPADDTGSIKMD
jgi:hypothetical protein